MTRYIVEERPDGGWVVLRDGVVVLRNLRTRAGAEIMAERCALDEASGAWSRLRILDDGSVEVRLADKIDWLRKHRTFTHYTAIVNEGKTSTDEAFATVADRLIADLERTLQTLREANEQTAATLGKLGRFVSPHPPAEDGQAEQETPTETVAQQAFDAAHFAAQMRTLSDHLDKAAPLLRELLAHCPDDLKASVSSEDVDRLIDLAATARIAAERAKQGKVPA